MATEEVEEPVRFMQQVVGLEYRIRPSELGRDYGKKLAEGRITGHKCPECGLVYVPPTGFCAICVVPTNAKEHEVDVADRGTVTSYTVVRGDTAVPIGLMLSTLAPNTASALSPISISS